MNIWNRDIMGKLFLGALAGLLITSQASADTLTLDETLGLFSVVTKDFSGNSESEGRVFIDGDATGSISINDRVVGDNGDGYDDLIIKGDATNARIKVGKSGNLTIGGNLTNSDLQLNGGVQTATLGGVRTGGTFNQNEDILIENATNLNIPDVDFDQYATESERLAKRGGDAVTKNSSGQTIFGGSSVLSVSFADLVTGTGVFDLLNGGPLLINVSGQTGSIGLNFVDHNGIQKIDAAKSVVWNFFEATQIRLGSAFFGHIVAPNADIFFDSSNEGNVIAGGVFVNNGEQHPLAYEGDVSFKDQPSAVPLPASFLLVLTGFGVLGASRKRRKA